MQIGLKGRTVSVEPHRIEWEIEAQKIISSLKSAFIEKILLMAAKWGEQL